MTGLRGQKLSLLEVRTYQIFRSVQDSGEEHFLEYKNLLVEAFWWGDVAQVADLVKSLRNKKKGGEAKSSEGGFPSVGNFSRQHGFTLLSIHPLTIPQAFSRGSMSIR